MPWMGVTVMEQRIRFPEDYRRDFYSVSELAEGFSMPINGSIAPGPSERKGSRSSRDDRNAAPSIHRRRSPRHC